MPKDWRSIDKRVRSLQERADRVQRLVEQMSALLRAVSLTEAALRAHERGATTDQLAEYLQEIHTTLLQWGGEDDEVDQEPGDPQTPADPEAPPELRRE